jgi:hypothetical protein
MEELYSVLSVKNSETIEFYLENPDINFEEANSILINIFKMCKGITEHDNNNSFHKKIPLIGKRDKLKNECELILSKINPTSTMVRNIVPDTFYDFMITTENKQKIIVATKETNLNIQNDEIELFLNNCEQLNSNGIFISHNSGIINKSNYHIDKIGKNIIVYIHFAEFNFDKIKIAFDIINNILSNIHDNNNNKEEDSSTLEILNEINKEHHVFTKQKNELKNNIKDNTNKLLNQLDDMKFNKLNTYLTSKCLSTEPVGLYKCDLCHFYTANKLKAMAAHKRGCKKKTHLPIS